MILEGMMFRGPVVTMIRMRTIEVKDGESAMERAGTVIIIGRIEIESMIVTANDRKRTVPHPKRPRSMDPCLKKTRHHRSTSGDAMNQKEGGTTHRSEKRHPHQRKEVMSTGMQNVPN
jgi:hypothetical protein